MSNVISWVTVYWPWVAVVLGIVLAALYAWSKGEALNLIARVWGLVVALAADTLQSIPAATFAQWAHLIREALPSIVQLFVSEAFIIDMLMKLRDALVKQLDPAAPKMELAPEDLAYLSQRVKDYLA